ncbi:MAG: hypothetical protein JWO47_964 [Candidatus Saccharibacteria bacterium]|nr:hypothetical protein [Candidatus Saccharibacteria bacterium]
MIVVRLMGGHSNQLFQYAIGKNLSKKLGTNLMLDLSWFKDFADVDTPRFYEIGCYPLEATVCEDLSRLRIVDPRQPIRVTNRLLRKMHLGSAIWMYYEQGQGYNPEALEQPDNTMLIGYWQTEKYFKDIRNELIAELEPTSKLSDKNLAIMSKIKNSESVSIHVRRGDYITNKNANTFHGSLGADYYQKAQEYIQKKIGIKNIQVFVFSNDIPWCKKNLKFDVPVTFVEGNDKGSDDMRLMKNCKHFVMANSSFSWWGSWLCTNPNKIVVAPKVWFKDKTANDAIDIMLNSWVRL